MVAAVPVLVVVNLKATVSDPAVESLSSRTAVSSTPTSLPLSVNVSSKLTPFVLALTTNSPVRSSVPLTILYFILKPLPASAGYSLIVVADDVLFASVCDFIALSCIPIPCISGAAFKLELPSDLLRSDLSKKSN